MATISGNRQRNDYMHLMEFSHGACLEAGGRNGMEPWVWRGHVGQILLIPFFFVGLWLSHSYLRVALGRVRERTIVVMYCTGIC